MDGGSDIVATGIEDRPFPLSYGDGKCRPLVRADRDPPRIRLRAVHGPIKRELEDAIEIETGVELAVDSLQSFKLLDALCQGGVGLGEQSGVLNRYSCLSGESLQELAIVLSKDARSEFVFHVYHASGFAARTQRDAQDGAQ